jgi:hypothetical protein
VKRVSKEKPVVFAPGGVVSRETPEQRLAGIWKDLLRHTTIGDLAKQFRLTRDAVKQWRWKGIPLSRLGDVQAFTGWPGTDLYRRVLTQYLLTRSCSQVVEHFEALNAAGPERPLRAYRISIRCKDVPGILGVLGTATKQSRLTIWDITQLVDEHEEPAKAVVICWTREVDAKLRRNATEVLGLLRQALLKAFIDEQVVVPVADVGIRSFDQVEEIRSMPLDVPLAAKERVGK